jgi:indole-3-glycerol phosphate synthase
VSVLAQIAEATRQRIEGEKKKVSPESLRAKAAGSRRPIDFAAALRATGTNIIAEVKLASPSEGPIGKGLDPIRVAKEYDANGAAAISVLTEPDFFNGKLEYLSEIRKITGLPLLMKDFVLDEYQLWQARALGADCCLLIAALLGPKLPELLGKAQTLGLSALVEVHNEDELEQALTAKAKLIGINNRNLKTLQIDLETSKRLAKRALANGATIVCESGLKTKKDIDDMRPFGFHGFLIGSSLIKTGHPGKALAELI